MKTFKGRVVVGGEVTARAMVSHTGFNTLASLKTAGSFINRKAVCGDQNNAELYQKALAGTALCLPETIGSTTGGMVLFSAGKLGSGPACMLFSRRADTLALSGAVLLANWSDHPMVLIDELGDEFLNTVKEGQTIQTKPDGTVIIMDAESAP